ncbi:MAG: hypothetical protein HYT22_00545 [Candidatus Niyogibacteria bacterium]|nr:hypothetical protein [Candidatus Niyogibacteria bacterium]
MLATKLADRLEKADERIVQLERDLIEAKARIAELELQLKDAKDLIAHNAPRRHHPDCECQACLHSD